MCEGLTPRRKQEWVEEREKRMQRRRMTYSSTNATGNGEEAGDNCRFHEGLLLPKIIPNDTINRMMGDPFRDFWNVSERFGNNTGLHD